MGAARSSAERGAARPFTDERHTEMPGFFECAFVLSERYRG